jgi:hypothetical protein
MLFVVKFPALFVIFAFFCGQNLHVSAFSLFAFRFFSSFHLTTHHPMLICPSSSNLRSGRRWLMPSGSLSANVSAIAFLGDGGSLGDSGFFGIVCPTGGRIKSGCPASAPRLQPGGLNSRYFKAVKGFSR